MSKYFGKDDPTEKDKPSHDLPDKPGADKPSDRPSDRPGHEPGHDLPVAARPGHHPDHDLPMHARPSQLPAEDRDLIPTYHEMAWKQDAPPAHISGGYVHPLAANIQLQLEAAKAEKRTQLDAVKAAAKDAAYSGNETVIDTLDDMVLNLEAQADEADLNQPTNVYREQADQLRRELNQIRYVT